MTASGMGHPVSMPSSNEEASCYDIRGLTPTYVGIWRLMTTSEKECVQYMRENLGYVRSENREHYLNHHFERGQINVTQYGLLSQISSFLEPTPSEMVSQVSESFQPHMSDIGSDMEADRPENSNLPIQFNVQRMGQAASIIPATVNPPYRNIVADRPAVLTPMTRELSGAPNRRDPITTPEFYYANFQEILQTFYQLTAEERIQLCSRKLCWKHITLDQYDELMVIAARICRSESTYAETVAAGPVPAVINSGTSVRSNMGPPVVPRSAQSASHATSSAQSNRPRSRIPYVNPNSSSF